MNPRLMAATLLLCAGCAHEIDVPEVDAAHCYDVSSEDQTLRMKRFEGSVLLVHYTLCSDAPITTVYFIGGFSPDEAVQTYEQSQADAGQSKTRLNHPLGTDAERPYTWVGMRMTHGACIRACEPGDGMSYAARSSDAPYLWEMEASAYQITVER